MLREILPTNIQPIKYTLDITPNFNNFKFKGLLKLDFIVIKPTSSIVLNAKELKINSFKIFNTLDTSNKNNLKNIKYEKELDRVYFELDNELSFGNYYVLINYTGIHNDKMAGFYRSKYVDKNGKEKYLLSTQFEAIDARRALPCLDEPIHKAKFKITLNIPKNLVGLSNTHVVSEKINNDLKSISFAVTPVMSTYLLAFFVGEAEYVEKYSYLNSGKKIRCRVYTPIGKKNEGEFALDLCCKVLQFYSDFFGIDYPLEKMDMIGIPDFAAGAMENWGLVTYRTKYILYDSEKTSKKLRTNIAYIICHELAHQWFGNLVTMSWWSELWLNEGFATWVGWMATNHFYPEWRIWESFYEKEYNQGMILDSLVNSHPIQVEINKASQIDEIFDAISYSKGACIIGMLVGFLGIDVFKKGIKKYLDTYQYSNATTKDLWNELGNSSGKPVNKIMSTWTKNVGFPLLNCSLKNNKLVIKQERFNKTDNTNWIIPLQILSGELVDNILIEDNTYEYSLNINNIFKLNNGVTGFYIIKYDDLLLDKIGKFILVNKFNTLDRADIINDIFYLAKFGYSKIISALNFCSNYVNETEYIVLERILGFLYYIKSVWYDNNKIVNGINKFTLNFLKNIKKNINFSVSTNEELFISLKRVLILDTLSNIGHKNTIEECNNIFNKYYSGDKQAIHPDLKLVVFKTIIYYGKDEILDKLLELYKTTDILDEKNSILNSIGYSLSENLINKVLILTFEENSIIRTQDIFYVIYGICSSPIGKDVLFNYIKNNWEKLIKKLKGGSFLFGKVISSMIDSFSSKSKLHEIKLFLEEHKNDVISLEKTINQAIERVQTKILIKENNTKSLEEYFN